MQAAPVESVVVVDDLPAEARDYDELRHAHEALQDLLAVKDGMIAHLLRERDGGGGSGGATAPMTAVSTGAPTGSFGARLAGTRDQDDATPRAPIQVTAFTQC